MQNTAVLFEMGKGDEPKRVVFQGQPTNEAIDQYFEEQCGGVYKWWVDTRTAPAPMELGTFAEVNAHIGEGQPEYQVIPAHVNPSGEGCPVTFCVKVSVNDLSRIADTGEIWVQCLTFGQPFQPLLIYSEKPIL